jgi:hypothetical protein
MQTGRASNAKMLQGLQGMHRLLIICVSLLCTTSAAYTDSDASVPVPASSSVFPAADMSLKLSFDLASPALLAPRGEQCFPFFPNVKFQGVLYCCFFFACVCRTLEISLPHVCTNELYSGGEVSITESVNHSGMQDDLFVTIRFQSTETGRASSCLQMGGASQLQGLDEAARLAVTRDCASAVREDWHWERAASPTTTTTTGAGGGGGGGGVSLVHTMTARDVASIAQEGDPRAEQWDICVASSSTGHMRGVITLFQHKGEAEEEAVAAGPPAGERHPRDHDAALPPSSPAPGPGPGLQKHSEGAALPVSGGTQVARQGDRQVPTAAAALVASAETPGAVDIFVDSPVDAAANASLCDSSINQASATTGQCNLRSAVASCEALLTSPATALCSVHLPALSDIAMTPELGEMVVQDAMMEGTMSIIGNGCHISPDAHTNTSVRFMRVEGNDWFSFRMSNLTLSHFGGSTLDGGAVSLQRLLSEDASSVEDVDFIGNVGRDGGALYMNQCKLTTLTSCSFTNNIAANNGGSVFVYSYTRDMALIHCIFTANAAEYNGGGLYVGIDSDFMNLTFCVFTKNTAMKNGGGLYVGFDNDYLLLSSCTFLENTASQIGGALFVSSNADMTLISCDFRNNIAVIGGGICVDSDNHNLQLTSTVFAGNVAEVDGGGMYLGSKNWDLQLMNVTFAGNVARSGNGGALAVAFYNYNMVVSESMFLDNVAGGTGKLSAFSANMLLLIHIFVVMMFIFSFLDV